MVFHLLHCLRAWTSQRISSDFETTRQLSPDFETTSRLPSDFLRPTKALLKCFRSYWAFASSSRHADGFALQLTPRSLTIAFSDVLWPPLGSVSASVLNKNLYECRHNDSYNFCSRPKHGRNYHSKFLDFFLWRRAVCAIWWARASLGVKFESVSLAVR